VTAPSIRAGDVRLGSVVGYQGEQWSVWSKGSQPGTFWLVRDGKWTPEAVSVREIESLGMRETREPAAVRRQGGAA
jgi:hypothetical protein